MGLAALVACATCALATVGAQAQQPTTSNPADELWRAYPLEQTPTTTAAPPARSAPAPGRRAGHDANTPWNVLAAVAGALATAFLVLLRRRRRAAIDEGPRRPALAPPLEPVGSVVEPWPVERARPAGPTPASPPPRPAPKRAAEVCQIRWSRRGGCFYAVTTDAQGRESRLAESPPLGPGEQPPPEESREAQQALRVLAKELRERGWRPLRARGFDLDDRRWYARRFRWPTEAEQEARPGAVERPAQNRVRGGAA
jgi:LPXTG-motif cell wall-anchored protein